MKKVFTLVLILGCCIGASAAQATKLADRKTMEEQLNRAIALQKDPLIKEHSSFITKHYFPYLLLHAGSKKKPEDIVRMFSQAKQELYFYVLTRFDPINTINMALEHLIPNLIRAILPKTEAKQAITLRKALKKAQISKQKQISNNTSSSSSSSSASATAHCQQETSSGPLIQNKENFQLLSGGKNEL